MYRNTESYAIVEDFLLASIPKADFHKARKEGNVLAVMSQAHNLLFLNEVAMDFLKLCNGTRTLAEIIEILHTQYETSRQQLTADVIDLIRDMQYKRVLYIDPLEQTTWTKQKKD